MKPAYNRHHLLYNRQPWTQTQSHLGLRENTDHIIRMPVKEHDQLHRDISYVPALSLHIARRALSTINTLPRPKTALDSISRLQDAIETSCDDERVDIIEYQVAQIAMQALELQRPYMPVKKPRVYDLGRKQRV